jgi:hypothetical protein
VSSKPRVLAKSNDSLTKIKLRENGLAAAGQVPQKFVYFSLAMLALASQKFKGSMQ